MKLVRGNPAIHDALSRAMNRSTHKRHQTGCVIVSRKGTILSDGCAHASDLRLNSLKSIHAEIHALGRGRHIDFDGAVAYIGTKARKSQNITYSAPCLTCAIALRSAGIRDVVYTVDDSRYSYLNLDEDLSFLKVYPGRWEV